MTGQRRFGMVLLSVLLVSLEGFAAGGATGQALGLVTGRDAVWVNHQPVLPGTTIFRGDVVETGKGSTAELKFRSGTTVVVAEGSEVAMGWVSEPTSLTLRQGALVVRSPQRARVSVMGAAVLVRAQGEFPALCRIAAVGHSAAIFNDAGRVEIHGAGVPLLLPPGKYAQLEAGQAAGGAQMAGKVGAAIPAETVQRVGQTAEVSLKVQDPVNWDDVVRTQKTGRVRIELLDGSALNVGARSVLRVLKHDPQTQQTTVEMTVGRVRAEVVKITKPGGSFQVRTQTAVIGVVGTIFVILATPQFTRVWCIEGMVTVQSLNAAVAGVATLQAGQFTTVAQNVPPTGVAQASSSQLQAQVNQTSAGGPGAPGGGVTGAGAGSNALNAGSAAASGVTAATSAITITRVSDAQSSLDTATNQLNSSQQSLSSAQQSTTAAQQSSNAAVTAANNAAAAANVTTTGTQTLTQQVLSPSVPCGCQ